MSGRVESHDAGFSPSSNAGVCELLVEALASTRKRRALPSVTRALSRMEKAMVAA